MRLDECLKFDGYFDVYCDEYLRNSRDATGEQRIIKNVVGNVEIETDGRISVTFFPSASNEYTDLFLAQGDFLNPYAYRNLRLKIKKIVGHCSQEYVTLFDVKPDGHSSSAVSRYTALRFRAEMAIIGVAPLTSQESMFDRIRFSIDYLYDFLEYGSERFKGYREREMPYIDSEEVKDLEGSEFEKIMDRDKEDYLLHGFVKKTVIKWCEPKPEIFRVDVWDNAKFSLEVKARSGEYGWDQERGVYPEAYCLLETEKAISLDEFLKRIKCLQSFFCFLFDRHVAITKLYGYNNKIKEWPASYSLNKEFPVDFRIYFSNDRDGQIKKGNDKFSCRYSDIEGDFEEYLNGFVRENEETENFLILKNLYLSTLSSSPFQMGYIENKIRALADYCKFLCKKFFDEKDINYDEGFRLLFNPLPSEMLKEYKQMLDEVSNKNKSVNIQTLVANVRNGIAHPESKGEDGSKEYGNIAPNFGIIHEMLVLMTKYYLLQWIKDMPDLNKDLVIKTREFFRLYYR